VWPKPRSEQRPKSFHGVDVDFAFAVAVLVPGVLPLAVVDRFVLIKAWQPTVYVVLIRENLGPLPDFLADDGFNGLSLDIVQRTDDYAAATLNHAQHGYFVILGRAPPPLALQSAAAAFAAFFFTAAGCPLCPAII
jgi:hypothetical protein